jgi:hypothetical protein
MSVFMSPSRRPTWAGTGVNDWWFWCISWRCQVLLLASQSDVPRPERQYPRYLIWGPHTSSYDTLNPSIRVSETQAPHVEWSERPLCEIRPRDTYSIFLIRRAFGQQRWYILFYSKNIVYFIVLYFILFILS